MVAQVLVLGLVQRRNLSKGGCPTIQGHARVCLLMAIKGKKLNSVIYSVLQSGSQVHLEDVRLSLKGLFCSSSRRDTLAFQKLGKF